MTVTFPMLLGLLFIGLKLGGIIAWPWVWVLAPFWVGLVMVVVIWFAVAVIAVAIGASDRW